MGDYLKGKQVLFFAPKFFGYEAEILYGLEKLGAIADYYDERPKNDFFTKAILRVGLKSLIAHLINKYYASILKKLNKTYDYVLIVNPEAMTPNILKNIKCLNQRARIIIYMWDSVQYKQSQLELLNIADKFITFDPNDLKFDKKIQFLPLFYINLFKNVSYKAIYKYDYSFIGSAHTDRYLVIDKIRKLLQNKKNCYMFFYSPSKIMFILKKFFDDGFKKIKFKDISFSSLSIIDVASIIADSKVVIDIQGPAQRGLTMRTIEVLGAKRKLITTNQDIKNYDFYNPNNIMIINRKNIVLNTLFFDSEYEELDNEIYNSYSLQSWITNVFK